MNYYPDDLKDAEDRMIINRRGTARASIKGRTIGLALSGGGIRSATFCLGFMQVLARRHVLRRVDFLSTVSGGGYAGSFLGRWITRDGIDEVEEGLADSKSNQVSFLRENGRYLAPNGTGDAISAAASYVRNWLTCLLVIGVMGIAAFLCVEVVRSLFSHQPPNPQLFPGSATSVEWSAFWYWAGGAVLLLDLPLVFAFWLPTKSWRRGWAPWFLVFVVAAVIGWHLKSLCPGLADAQIYGKYLLVFLCAVFLCAVLFFAVIGQLLVTAFGRKADWVRLRFTQYLGGAIVLTCALVVLAAIDTLVLTASKPGFSRFVWSNAVVALPGLLAAGYKFLPWITEFTKKKSTGFGSNLLIGVCATLVGVAVLFMLGYSAHKVATELVEQCWFGSWMRPHPVICQAGAALIALGFAILLGRAGFWFVNYASFHRIYSTRLTRAYLGASNPSRQNEETKNWDMTNLLKDDNISIRDYRPHEKGGPLHLINATVNETISESSNTEKRDRKGFGISLGPAGITARTTDYILFEAQPSKPPSPGYALMRQRLAQPGEQGAQNTGKPAEIGLEMMTLGDWVGISGAAFTTGMGARTNIATSFLLGYFNIRLGYWWDSGPDPWVQGRKRAFEVTPSLVEPLFTLLFPAQSALLSEYFAKFHGPDRRRWYLSDGGHFENTAVYELIRRKVGLIICCDCGCDPEYTFEDVGNLVRKARIDFCADIDFVTTLDAESVPAIIRSVAGSITDLIPSTLNNDLNIANKQVALATIRYEDGSKGILVVVKPSLYAACPLDLQNYASSNTDFPQQSTLDQFFDEAQWESYRKLGESIGSRLFGNDTDSAAAIIEALLNLEVGRCN